MQPLGLFGTRHRRETCPVAKGLESVGALSSLGRLAARSVRSSRRGSGPQSRLGRAGGPWQRKCRLGPAPGESTKLGGMSASRRLAEPVSLLEFRACGVPLLVARQRCSPSRARAWEPTGTLAGYPAPRRRSTRGGSDKTRARRAWPYYATSRFSRSTSLFAPLQRILTESLLTPSTTGATLSTEGVGPQVDCRTVTSAVRRRNGWHVEGVARSGTT